MFLFKSMDALNACYVSDDPACLTSDMLVVGSRYDSALRFFRICCVVVNFVTMGVHISEHVLIFSTMVVSGFTETSLLDTSYVDFCVHVYAHV